MTPVLWPQLKDATHAARLMAQTGAVRKALGHMLADPAYPEALKSRPWVEKWLDTAAWSEQLREGLTILALRYYGHRDDAIAQILRAALGRADTSPREREALQGTPHRTDGKESAMATVTDVLTFDNGLRSMVDHYGDPRAREALRRQRDDMQAPPFNTPPSKLEDAFRMVNDGKVELDGDIVTVKGSKGNKYTIVNHRCNCGWATAGGTKEALQWSCDHAVAAELHQRTQQALDTHQPLLLTPTPTVEERLAQTPPQETSGATISADWGGWPEEDAHAPQAILEASRVIEEEPVSTTGGEQVQARLSPSDPEPLTISAKYVTWIHDKPHVQFQGLVLAAQDAGLVSLAVDWTYNDAELSLAHAVAKFRDGRIYEESGDATPGNVRSQIRQHFRRMALTRAGARCLRNALGIGEAAIEELDVESPPSGAGRQEVPDMTRGRTTPPHSKPFGEGKAGAACTLSPREQIKQLLAILGFHPQTEGAAKRIIAEQTEYELTAANYAPIIQILQHMVAARA